MGLLEDKRFVFIVGSPRSGTTWLRAMLGAHQSVSATVELTLFDKYISSWRKYYSAEQDHLQNGKGYVGLPFLWDEDEFDGFLRSFLENAYSKLLEKKPSATHIVDKRPHNALHVEEIHRLIPQARFVHIIRDGRDVVLSMLDAHHKFGWYSADYRRNVMIWRDHVLAARVAHKYTGLYLEIRYEDLVSNNGVNTLRQVFDFCKIPASQKEIDEIYTEHHFDRMKKNRDSGDHRVKLPTGHFRKGRAGTWVGDTSAVQRFHFDRTAGRLLCELGYAFPGWWARSQMDKRSIILRAALQDRLDVFQHILLKFSSQGIHYLKRLARGVGDYR